MPTHDEIKAAGASDVGDWGEKDLDGAYDGPLLIAGEKVDLRKLPAFGENEKDSPSSMGGLSADPSHLVQAAERALFDAENAFRDDPSDANRRRVTKAWAEVREARGASPSDDAGARFLS